MTVPSHKIYFLLQRAAHKVRGISDNLLLTELGVTTAQIAVMKLISSNTNVTQKLIAQELQQNESAITAMVNRLIKGGFVKRKRNETDLRSWTLSLTKTGKAICTDGGELFAQINSRLSEAVGESDIAELASALSAISRLK